MDEAGNQVCALSGGFHRLNDQEGRTCGGKAHEGCRGQVPGEQGEEGVHRKGSLTLRVRTE